MLYTRAGDGGTSKLFVCQNNERILKSDEIFYLLGVFDELNCHIGFAKSLISNLGDKEIDVSSILDKIQNDIFAIQAHIAGAEIVFKNTRVLFLEEVINSIENKIPKINSFIVPGGSKEAAYLEVCRAVSRRVERDLIKISKNKELNINENIFPFINRLSSIMYALSRFTNYYYHYKERGPNYEN